ncbi:MAG: IS91 family transposase [Salinivirgaceae bacterium]
MSKPENLRQTIEVADVIRLCRSQIEQTLSLSHEQMKAIDAIERCRTKDAGGHISYCTNCSHYQQAYNSCRNRHCPKCQFLKQHQWVDKLTSRLMPGRYFHLVFTVPSALHNLFLYNQDTCYDLLFQSASDALQSAGRNPAFLGADVGALCVLHTWSQTLTYHPHIHMLVPAGGLACDGMEWVAAGKSFFVPVKALSAMFRGRFVGQLQKHLESKQLRLPKDYESWNALKCKLYAKSWNVYSKKAFGGVTSVLSYLGRYTHRVAISNSRIQELDETHVTFSYKDNRQGGVSKSLSLSPCEFVRRFLMHVLPAGFCKIRYVGLLATVHIYGKRQQSIALIGQTIWLSTLEGLNTYELLRTVLGKDPAVCAKCGKGIMVRRPLNQAMG